MKRISIQTLKATLSSAIADAEAGETIVITRHNKSVAQLSPAHLQHVHVGSRVGHAGLKPAVTRGTNGRYLEVLLEDRGDR
jgi:antitoxin (DNA-binding transcriptional repressor) of toxin-antitoxin stability system